MVTFKTMQGTPTPNPPPLPPPSYSSHISINTNGYEHMIQFVLTMIFILTNNTYICNVNITNYLPMTDEPCGLDDDTVNVKYVSLLKVLRLNYIKNIY